MAHTHVTPAAASRNRLGIVFGITLAVFLFELVGGIAANSLALIADAGHLLTDLAGIGLTLVAIWFAARPANRNRSYGLMRLEILAAVVNAMLLFAVAAYVLVEAWRRWNSPPEIEAGLMLVVAVVGLVANAVSLAVLRDAQRESLPMRGAYLEVMGDLVGLGGRDRGRARDRRDRPGAGRRHRVGPHRRADPAPHVDAAQGRGRRAARGVAQGHRPRRRPGAHPRGARGRRRPRPPRLDDHLGDERRLGARRARRPTPARRRSSTTCAAACRAISTSSTRRSSSRPRTGAASRPRTTPERATVRRGMRPPTIAP